MTNTESLRPSELALASYGSPLRKPVIGWLLAAALLALIIFSLTQLVPFFKSSNPQHVRVLLTALAVTGAITVIPVLILRWLDRREPEPWVLYVLALAWGGLIATGIAGDINHNVDKVLGGFLGGILAAPFIEEAAKGLGLLVLVLLLRDEFDGPRDGFIYGALIGLGFTWLESSVYIARSFDESGTVAWAFQLGSRYVLAGLNGHAIYTGLFGLFLGFGLIQKRWPRKILLPIVGYVLAAGSHMAWNSLGTVASAATSTALGMLTHAARCRGRAPRRHHALAVLAELAVEPGRALGGQRHHALDHLHRPAPQRPLGTRRHGRALARRSGDADRHGRRVHADRGQVRAAAREQGRA